MKFLRSKSRRVHVSRRVRSLRYRKSAMSVCVWGGVDGGDMAREGRVLWDLYGGNREYARSFWIGRNDTPRCALEAFAQECATLHCPSYEGAEFWIQIRETALGDEDRDSEGLEFHFDKDEYALKRDDAWVHPEISTVTYLDAANSNSHSCEWGPPLVVFDTNSCDTPCYLRQRRRTVTPRHCWIVFPEPGKHVAFKGNLLHGVPAELSYALQQPIDINYPHFVRMSLPVNVWAQRKPALIEKLPMEFIKKVSKYDSGGRYFKKAVPVDLLGVVAPVCNGVHLVDDTAEVKQKCDMDTSAFRGRKCNCCGSYVLTEHVPGDTAHIPLEPIANELFRRKISDADAHCGVCIRYK